MFHAFTYTTYAYLPIRLYRYSHYATHLYVLFNTCLGRAWAIFISAAKLILVLITAPVALAIKGLAAKNSVLPIGTLTSSTKCSLLPIGTFTGSTEGSLLPIGTPTGSTEGSLLPIGTSTGSTEGFLLPVGTGIDSRKKICLLVCFYI